MRAPGANESPLPQPAWLEDGEACHTRDTPLAYPLWQDLFQLLRKQEVVGQVRVLSECLRCASSARARSYPSSCQTSLRCRKSTEWSKEDTSRRNRHVCSSKAASATCDCRSGVMTIGGKCLVVNSARLSGNTSTNPLDVTHNRVRGRAGSFVANGTDRQ